MTKKSIGRQERDAAKQNEQNQQSFWVDLTGIYYSLRNALENAVRQVQILYRAEGLVAHLNKGDPREIAVAMVGLGKDYANLLARLTVIYDKHKDVDASMVSDQDALRAIEINGEYDQWRSDFLGVVMPNVEYLIAEINLVLNEVRRQVAANGLAIVKNELSEETTPA